MTIQKENVWAPAVAIVSCLVIFLVVWIVHSHFEAKSYNRICGTDVTTGEAMWVQMRVQGDCR